jgi:hypothetical protein
VLAVVLTAFVSSGAESDGTNIACHWGREGLGTKEMKKEKQYKLQILIHSSRTASPMKMGPTGCP